VPLLDWLQKYTFPAEHKFKDVEYAERMYPPVIKNTLKRGTTTAAYFASRHKEATLVLAREAAQNGQRAFVGKVNMDSNAVAEYYQDESAQQSVKDTEGSKSGGADAR
jgi:guanine deaminase